MKISIQRFKSIDSVKEFRIDICLFLRGPIVAEVVSNPKSVADETDA